MRFKYTLALVVAAAAAIVATPVQARKSLLSQIEDAASTTFQPGSTTVPATGQLEFAFSPNGGGESLVIKTIRSAHRDVRVLAYALTNPAIVQALIAAHKRGVDVRVVADFKQNVSEDRSGKGRAALNALATAGVGVRTISAYPIHHDKVVITDGQNVQTGSFNYSQAAEKTNSENVLVLWANPSLAHGYLKHWDRNWRQGNDWRTSY